MAPPAGNEQSVGSVDVESSGEDAEITAYGKPTRVRLVADRAAPKKWVSGATVNALPDVDADETLAADIAAAFVDEDYIADPWADRE